MSIDSRIALGLQPLNVGQRFAQNVQNLQQVDLLNQRREQAPLQNKLLELGVNEQQRQADILGSAQSQALLSQEQANKLDVANATQLNPFLQANDVQGALSTLNQQRARAQELGMTEDVAEFDQAIQLAQTPQGLETLKQVTTGFLQAGDVLPRTVAKTASQRDFETFQELNRKANKTKKLEDIKAAEQFGRQSGFDRPTEQQKSDIKVTEAEQKEVKKSNAKRKQGFIDAGVEAADSVANIRRSIDLLETVKTGGLDKASFRIRQAFGVEGADEGELSANLGRSVLAQLKPIFGAAFTAAEGERLERIEAGFGRSPETNKRLLNSALKMAERAARRGLAAAEDQGDTFTAEEIKDAMSFTFKEPTEEQVDVEQSQIEQDPAQQQPTQQFNEGQTATNPQTGQKLVFKNGQWVEL